MALILGELLKHGQLIRFLEAAQANAHRPCLGRNHDHRAVRPVGRCNCRYTVANARAVLPNHHAVSARDAGIPVGHVGRTLLVHHRNKTNARRRKNVHGVHEGRPHDAKHLTDAIGNQRLNKGFRRRHFLHAFHGDSEIHRAVHVCLAPCKALKWGNNSLTKCTTEALKLSKVS